MVGVDKCLHGFAYKGAALVHILYLHKNTIFSIHCTQYTVRDIKKLTFVVTKRLRNVTYCKYLLREMNYPDILCLY